MRSIVTNWAIRYYYTGIGLPVPGKLQYEDHVYEKAFSELLEEPIKRIMGRREIDDQGISTFLKAYQSTGVRSPFYMLGQVADAYCNESRSGTLEQNLRSAVYAVVGHLAPAIGMVPHGVNVPVYADEHQNVYGLFPRKVHFVCMEHEGYNTKDIANELLAKDPMNLTESDIKTMKRIRNINKDYASQVRSISLEVRQGSYFVQSTVTPFDPNFPPYEVRKLMQIMPTAHEYSSKHEQILHYLQDMPSEAEKYPGALKYLQELFRVDPEPAPVENVEYPADTAVISIPDEQVKFEGLDELLQYYIDNGTVKSYWTVGDVVGYFASEDAPEPVAYNPNMRALDTTQAEIGLHILKTLEKFIPEGVELKTALRALANDKPMPKPVTANEALNEVIRKYNINLNDVSKQQSPKELAQQLIDSGLPEDLSLGELVQGRTRHVPAVYQSKEELLSSGVISEALKAEVFPKEKSTRELAIELIAAGVDGDMSLNDVVRGASKPKAPTLKELATQIADMGYSTLTVADIIEGRDAPVQYNTIAELKAAQILSPDFKETESYSEFGYVAAEAILKHIREGLAGMVGKPFAEENAYRMKLIPIYYGFVRMLGFNAAKPEDALVYLEELKAEVDPEVKGYIDNAIARVMEVIS